MKKIKISEKDLIKILGILIGTLVIAIIVLFFHFNTTFEKLSAEQIAGFQEIKSDLDQANLSTQQKIRVTQDILEQKNVILEQTVTQELEIIGEVIKENKNQSDEQYKEILDLFQKSESERKDELSKLKQDVSKIGAEAGHLSLVVDEVLKYTVSIDTRKRGSGAIIDNRGFIVTNYHVVENEPTIRVRLYSGPNKEAQLVGFNNVSDIALLKIDMPSNLEGQLNFVNSNTVRVGEKVFAVGAPVGLDFTVTEGIVSATNREISGLPDYYIQTSVPINQGNSGGPLINNLGQIIGINTFKYGGAEGLGFAIPSNIVKFTTDNLIKQWEQHQAELAAQQEAAE